MRKWPAVIFMVMVCFIHCSIAHAQTKIDSLAGEHLAAIKEIDTAVYRSKIKGRTQEIVTNYFTTKKQQVVVNGISISLYKFGSYGSHVTLHLLLIANDNIKDTCFMDCLNVESDIEELFRFLSTFSHSSSFKIKVLKSVMEEYPDQELTPKGINNRTKSTF